MRRRGQEGRRGVLRELALIGRDLKRALGSTCPRCEDRPRLAAVVTEDKCGAHVPTCGRLHPTLTAMSIRRLISLRSLNGAGRNALGSPVHHPANEFVTVTLRRITMAKVRALLERNKAWAERTRREDPEYFTRLAQGQEPDVLWIGCSDSRVPANQVLDVPAGSLFVHRNVANVVVHSDMNCLSVIQYAVEVLRVADIMVVGHYGCGGVAAALGGTAKGIINNWLRHIDDVAQKHDDISTTRARADFKLGASTRTRDSGRWFWCSRSFRTSPSPPFISIDRKAEQSC